MEFFETPPSPGRDFRYQCLLQALALWGITTPAVSPSIEEFAYAQAHQAAFAGRLRRLVTPS